MNARPQRLIATDVAPLSRPVSPRPVSDTWQRRRLAVHTLLLTLFFVLPWVTWGGSTAVLFDIPARQLHVFSVTLWPQDFHLFALMLIVGAFGLFAVTNWIGRVWCGYACPHSVFFSLFAAIERRLQGPPGAKGSRAAGKATTWILWSLLALATAVTMVGFFVPVRSLVVDLATASLTGWPLLWVAMFFVTTYVAGGLWREQVCLHMCPYARFQSVMYDQDTKSIAYDATRGEPRGSRRRDAEAGDCVDCSLCVQVCPTGIDIRNGLQYECIGCGLCIDACNGVMDKLKRPRNLIGYYTGNQLEGRPEPRRRPRLVGYAGAFGIMLLVLGIVFVTRGSIELDVQRDRSALYTDVLTSDGPMRENSYLLSVQNKRSEAISLELSASGEGRLEWFGEQLLDLAAGERRQIPVRLRAAPDDAPVRRIAFEAHESGHDSATLARQDSSFFSSPPGPGS